MPVCAHYNIWMCSRGHDWWSPGSSWLGHQSAPQQPVVQCSDSGCIDTRCPRGVWLDSGWANGQAWSSMASSLASLFRKCWHRCHAPEGTRKGGHCSSIWSMILWEWVWGPACSDHHWPQTCSSWVYILVSPPSSWHCALLQHPRNERNKSKY